MEIEGCSIEVPGVPDAFAQGKHTLLHMNIHVHALIYVINMKIIVIKSMIFSIKHPSDKEFVQMNQIS